MLEHDRMRVYPSKCMYVGYTMNEHYEQFFNMSNIIVYTHSRFR